MKPLKFLGFRLTVINGIMVKIPVVELMATNTAFCFPAPYFLVKGHDAESEVQLFTGTMSNPAIVLKYKVFNSDGLLMYKFNTIDLVYINKMPNYKSEEDFKLQLPKNPYMDYVSFTSDNDTTQAPYPTEEFLNKHPNYRGLVLKENSMTLRELLENHAAEMFERLRGYDCMMFFIDWLFSRTMKGYFAYALMESTKVVRLSCLIMNYVMCANDMKEMFEHEITTNELNNILTMAMREEYPAYINFSEITTELVRKYNA